MFYFPKLFWVTHVPHIFMMTVMLSALHISLNIPNNHAIWHVNRCCATPNVQWSNQGLPTKTWCIMLEIPGNLRQPHLTVPIFWEKKRWYWRGWKAQPLLNSILVYLYQYSNDINMFNQRVFYYCFVLHVQVRLGWVLNQLTFFKICFRIFIDVLEPLRCVAKLQGFAWKDVSETHTHTSQPRATYGQNINVVSTCQTFELSFGDFCATMYCCVWCVCVCMCVCVLANYKYNLHHSECGQCTGKWHVGARCADACFLCLANFKCNAQTCRQSQWWWWRKGKYDDDDDDDDDDESMVMMAQNEKYDDYDGDESFWWWSCQQTIMCHELSFDCHTHMYTCTSILATNQPSVIHNPKWRFCTMTQGNHKQTHDWNMAWELVVVQKEKIPLVQTSRIKYTTDVKPPTLFVSASSQHSGGDLKM